MKLYRIWSYNMNNWIDDQVVIDCYGNVTWTTIDDIFKKKNNIKLELNTSFKDKNGEPLFVGDIIRHEDGNCGYGRLRDHYLDGYIYEVISENYIIQLTEDLYNDDLITTFEKVGNIHETKLTDEMKYWIDIEFRRKFQKEHGKEKAVW